METTPRPGYKSTEFYLALAATLVAALLASGLFSDGGSMEKMLGLAGGVLASLGYTAARAFTKVNEAKAAALIEASKNPLPPA